MAQNKSQQNTYLKITTLYKAYRVYNKRTKKVMETVHVVIDEVSDFGFEESSEEIPKEILPSEPKVV